jgi:hypothetical protein
MYQLNLPIVTSGQSIVCICGRTILPFLSSGKELLWVVIVGWMDGWMDGLSVVGKKYVAV